MYYDVAAVDQTGTSRVRRPAAVAILLLVLVNSGCGGGSPAQRATGNATTHPSGAGAVQGRISWPECVGRAEGRLEQRRSAPGTVTPVLLLGDGPRGVVVGAQANGGICQTVPFARELVARGYHVALFEWRDPYAAAMTAASAALEAAGIRRLVLAGFSRGAVVALGVAPELGPRVAGVIAVSGGPSPTEGFPTLRSVSRFDGPELLVGSTDDDVFPPGTNKAIAARHDGAETVVEVPGYDHALALLDGDHAVRVRRAIRDFLAYVLG